MKNILKSIVLVLAVTFMVSCSGGNDPESVTEDFLMAVGTKDFEKASKLSTERTAKVLVAVQGMLNLAEQSGEDTEIGDMPKIEIIKTEIDGDKAICYYSTEEGGEEKINLVKVDGQWKVDMTKSDINKES